MNAFSRSLLRPFCLVAGTLVATSAFAQAYVGVGVGQGHAKLPSTDTTFQGFPFSGSGDKSHDTSWKLYAGYQFTPNWGLEAGYNDLGHSYSFKGTANGLPFDGSYKMDNWYAAGTGTLPLGSGFSLLGKIGVTYNTAKAGSTCISGVGCFDLGHEHHTDLLLGAGAQYAFTKNWAARLEYEDYGKMTNNDVWGTGSSGTLKADAWYLSVNYAF